ncbi:alpha/beta hydrolase [Tissierella praeacuta]|uniref:alpha/beta hydrolase n=1 Tax=Tissierella praeacuta TaxID=43131 RepID=UPI00333E5F72
MVHELGRSRWTNYPIATMFLENGYNVVSYDQRSSGENMAEYTTFGYLESHDLENCMTYLIDNIDENKKIGVFGASFGGVTVGMHLDSEQASQNVDFAILDCPVSDMAYMISTKMEEMDMGISVSFLMSMGDVVNKMKLGFSYEDANVCNYVSKTKVPVLVINTKENQITPYFMGEDIYNAIPHNNKRLFTVEDSKHVEIDQDYPNEYEESIIDFIKQLP